MISKLKDRTFAIIKAEEEKENIMKKSKQNLRNLRDTIKQTNISIIGDQEGEEKVKGAERLSTEIMTKNFPSLIKYINLQVQKFNKF